LGCSDPGVELRGRPIAELPKTLQLAFEPGKDFEPLPKPGPYDWLAWHPEKGQTFEQFVRSKPLLPNTQRDTIYLQPLGERAQLPCHLAGGALSKARIWRFIPPPSWARVQRRRGGNILTPMRSVADDLREELQEEVLRLSFEERMALALRLGERGLEMFRQASGLDRETAIRELQRQRQAGRTPSKCMSELIG
jgi:hypothetical protein